jgi:hypothetical protein
MVNDKFSFLCYDIETPRGMFLLSIYSPLEDKWIDCEISRRKNQIDLLVKCIETYNEYYWVGFNNIKFDAQIIEWIVRNYENWIDLSGETICQMIYQKAQDVIDNGNYELPPEYREEQLSFKQIDLFAILHFGNLSRRTSLKAVAFALDVEDIEENPIDIHSEHLTDEEMDAEIAYCHKDVIDTYALYKVVRGNTEISIYKGKDKIADRFVMQEEFGLNCLNWDDVKIGAEWNKLDYIKLTRKSERDLHPKQIIQFYGKKYKQFFPRYIKFQTPELQRFINNFGESFVTNKKQEFTYKFSKDLSITIAKGGIHSCENGRIIIPKEGEMYLQIDVGSQYPNAIRKYRIEPKHLPGWNSLIVSKIERRLSYKQQFKDTKNPKYASMQEMGKLSLNGGAYGRLNTKGDWQEYPYGMLQVTIGCQLEILMIVEDLIIKGFNVTSLNTDGYDLTLPKNRLTELIDLIEYWEKLIGNDTLGRFELTEFEWIVQTSVNDYLAKKKGEWMNGKFKPHLQKEKEDFLKLKGDFEIDKELHKNKSMRIVPIALKEYFLNHVPIEQTIMSHTNIYDFCIRQKATKDFHYEGISNKGKNIYNKLIRYYVSNEGEKLLKIKNSECTTNAPPVSQVEAGDWKMFVCNKLTKDHPLDNINFKYYIEKAEKIIAKVEGKKTVKINPNQLSLF